MPLTDTACKNSKPKDKPYKKFDGGGLYLHVKPNGSRLWRLKYRFMSKEKLLSIGVYPTIGLAKAREVRDEAKKLLACVPPKDPMLHKTEAKLAAQRVSQNTFKLVALEWHQNNLDVWSAGYANKIMRCLEKHLFPILGNRPIADITPPELLVPIRKIEESNHFDMAKKAKQIAGMVFRYGIQTGKCEWNAADNLTGALKGKKTSHFAALDESELPAFIDALKRNEARIFERTRRAVWFSLYTFQRPGEIRQAQWSEIDFDAKEWRIHEDKMKMRRAHIVPLSDQVIEILKVQRLETEMLNTDWVFPSQAKLKNPMSDGTVNKAIQRLGFGEQTKAHGFRALARTVIRERLKYDSEVIEKQLAHKTSNPLGEAYDRTQFLDERKTMMQDWASHLDYISNTGEVIKARFGNE